MPLSWIDVQFLSSNAQDFIEEVAINNKPHERKRIPEQ